MDFYKTKTVAKKTTGATYQLWAYDTSNSQTFLCVEVDFKTLEEAKEYYKTMGEVAKLKWAQENNTHLTRYPKELSHAVIVEHAVDCDHFWLADGCLIS